MKLTAPGLIVTPAIACTAISSSQQYLLFKKSKKTKKNIKNVRKFLVTKRTSGWVAFATVV